MKTEKTETRLDRIETAIEQAFVGIVQLRESIGELKDSQRKTDEQLRKTDEQLRKTDEQLRRTDRKLAEIGRQLGALGLVQGEVAEDLFYRNLVSVFGKVNVRWTKVKRRVKRKGQGEYDLVAMDGGRILVIEVKNKLERRMVDEFIDEKLPRFKEVFPEYRDSRLEGGIGALVVKDDVGRYAEKAGLYVLAQTDEGGAALLNRKGFKPREFA